MYKLHHFTEENEEAVFDFIRKNSFAIITGYDGSVPVATHVPLAISKKEGKTLLIGHVMKNSDHHKAFSENENVLVIFSGPHCYVSASWYQNKEVASTWNYMDVHAKGKIRFGNEADTKKIIEDITDTYEGRQSEAAFHRLSPDYINKMVKAIIGFTIEVSELANVFKLSQNHDVVNRQNIVAHLMQRSDENCRKIAEEMEKRF